MMDNTYQYTYLGMWTIATSGSSFGYVISIQPWRGIDLFLFPKTGMGNFKATTIVLLRVGNLETTWISHAPYPWPLTFGACLHGFRGFQSWLLSHRVISQWIVHILQYIHIPHRWHILSWMGTRKRVFLCRATSWYRVQKVVSRLGRWTHDTATWYPAGLSLSSSYGQWGNKWRSSRQSTDNLGTATWLGRIAITALKTNVLGSLGCCVEKSIPMQNIMFKHTCVGWSWRLCNGKLVWWPQLRGCKALLDY